MGEYQNIAIPLIAGMDSKTEDTLIPAPKLALAYNTQVKKAGGYGRRNGHTAMTALDMTGATVSGQRATQAYLDSVVMFNATKAYEYSSTATRWVDKGACLPTKLTITGITAPADTTPILVDVAVTSNGYAVYGSIETDGAGAMLSKMHVLDSAGTYIGSRTMDVPTAAVMRVVSVGVRAWMVWATGASTLRTMVFDGTSATTVNASLTSTATVASAADLGGLGMDIAPRPVAGNVLVAYLSTTAGQIKWGFLDTAGALANTSTQATGRTPGGVACAVETGEVLHGIVYSDGTNPNDVYALHRSFSAGSWTATATSAALDTALTVGIAVALACHYSNSSTLSVYYSEIDTTNGVMRTYRSTYTSGGTIASRVNTIRHTWLASKPVLYQGTAYFIGYQCGTENPALPESVDNPTFYLFDHTGIPVARMAAGTAMPQFAGLSHPTNLTLSGTTMRAALMETTKTYESPSTSIIGLLAVRDVRIAFTDNELMRSFQWADSLYLPGGIMLEYDGVSFVEANFLNFATTSSWTANSSNTGGGLTNPKTYFVVVIPEWTNARGKKHLGTHGGSKSVAVTGAGEDSITTVIDCSTATLKRGTRNDFVWGVYRTNDTVPSDNSVFYRVGGVANDPDADVVTFVDEMTDGNATLQERIYLDTGELDNTSAPGGYISACGNGRVAVAGGRTAGNIVTISKLATDGRALEFNDALTIVVPEDGGPITAMSWLNETLIIFKEERIYRIRGDGPNNLGQGVFAEPELLTTDVGCIAQQGVVAAPDGLFFQAKRGIMLITGGFQITYVGAPVESPPSPGSTLGTCVDSVLVPKKQQVRFSDGTTAFVYDYYHGLWFVWSVASDGPSTVYSDVHTMPVGSAVWQQDDAVWRDDGTDYFAKVSLAWVAGPQSKLQNIRVRKVGVLGEIKGTSALTVALKYGSLDSSVQLFETTGLASGMLRHVIQPSIGVTNQFRVDLFDADLTGSPTYTTSEGMVWTEVTFEALIKKGLHIR